MDDSQVPNILIRRTNQLMDKMYLTKKEMAERLGMEYLTFWRKLNGKRGIDVPLLMKIAKVLGTSASYLLGETDNPILNDAKNEPIIIQTNDPSRKIVTEPSRLTFNNGVVSIEMPDTPINRELLDNFVRKALENKNPKEQSPTVPA